MKSWKLLISQAVLVAAGEAAASTQNKIGRRSVKRRSSSHDSGR
jgi:hypothetical protein